MFFFVLAGVKEVSDIQSGLSLTIMAGGMGRGGKRKCPVGVYNVKLSLQRFGGYRRQPLPTLFYQLAFFFNLWSDINHFINLPSLSDDLALNQGGWCVGGINFFSVGFLKPSSCTKLSLRVGFVRNANVHRLVRGLALNLSVFLFY